LLPFAAAAEDAGGKLAAVATYLGSYIKQPLQL
jgi:hypothetical protein